MAHGTKILGRRATGSVVAQLVARLFARPEPVAVVEQRYGFLPARFRWSGEIWRVRRVVHMWDTAETMFAPPRRFFAVLCQDGGERTLVQDLRIGAWFVYG